MTLGEFLGNNQKAELIDRAQHSAPSSYGGYGHYAPHQPMHQQHNMQHGHGYAYVPEVSYPSYPSHNSPQYGGGGFRTGGYTFSGHSHKGGGGKGGAALSALTLLAFLFFLNILQNCLKEHMMAMNPEVTVMTAGLARDQTYEIQNIQNEESASIRKSRSIGYDIFATRDKNSNIITPKTVLKKTLTWRKSLYDPSVKRYGMISIQ